jgi:amino acid adenylation domain-containing protein/non-ribosomal peptide synthase protein (TIGR01720 family)
MEYIHSKDSISKGPELNILPYFAKTLPELIKNSIIVGPDRGVIFVDTDGSETKLSYKNLLEDASKALTGLRLNGLEPGDKVVLQIENDRLFLTVFWGAVLGGGIPVPLALPNSFPISEGSEKVANVCSLIGNPFIVTDKSPSEYKDIVSRAVLLADDLMSNKPGGDYHNPDPDDIGYIQFSSGSTGDAKGVTLTHRNILTNIYAILEASTNQEQRALRDEIMSNPLKEYDISYSVCSWLPYSHDMGLIGFHLAPMAASMLQIKMSTTTFVINPTLNVLLIDKYRVTQIPSPNFGLLWMLYMVKNESIKGIDLSCVEVLFNGAEPISPLAVRLFIDRFRQYGFNPKAMFPVYGMAEAALMVTSPPINTDILYHMLDRESFTKNHVAVDAKADLPVIEFVDEGYPAMGMELRIVDNDDNVVKEGTVGHIQIKGPNVTSGYYKKEELNSELFCNGWLRTGDLGFLLDGRLTVTGRHKDVIFVNGQNYYSHDIEEELQQLPFVGFKNMVVCGVTDHDRGTESIVLFIKTKKSKESLIELLGKINKHLANKIRVGIEAIVPMHDIPRTTSGKAQRFILRERYEAGDFREREVKRIDQHIYNENIPKVEQKPLKKEGISIRKKELSLNGLINDLPFAIVESKVHQFLPQIVKNLPQVLRIACTIAPNSGVLHVDEQGNEHLQTYKDLMNSAEKVLGGLRAHGYKPGDQAILQIENSEEFLEAFWGIILAGVIPVPLPIPGTFPISEGMERITKVCGVLDKFCIISDQPEKNYRSLGKVDFLNIEELLKHEPDNKHHDPKPHDIAYLQFSSGSTGDPKGVMLTHYNLIYTIDASAKCVFDVRGNDIRPTLGYGIHILRHKFGNHKGTGAVSKLLNAISKSSLGEKIRMTKSGKYILDTALIFSGSKISSYTDMRIDEIKIVNWMPYSHDMGLIGFHLAPTMGGMDQVKLEPKTFIQNPALFLKLIDKYRGTHVPCPNFAAQWLTTQVNDDDIKGIDLSCIKSLTNGSEPISPLVSRDFINKYEKFGLDSRSMFMCYGMAEASLQVTAPPVFTEPIYHKADKDVFLKDQIILPVRSDEDSIELTDVGGPVAGMKIRVVDDNDVLVHEYTIGHIQIQGPNVVTGYYNNEAANKDLFCGEWLRTGDMGFMKNGRITITGRRKDIIFINGQNLYAHDIEEQIKRVPGMAFREFAVAGLRHLDSDSERVILFVNTAESITSLSSLLSRINENLVSTIGIKLDFIIPVSEIPRTPSAKIKRYSLRERFEKGMYETVISTNDIGINLAASKDEKGFELTPLEQRVIEIWREVLGLDAISKFDNFFDLGGNSLRATKVTSRIREEFSIEIGLKTIFEYQTVESLAKMVESITQSEPKVSLVISPIEKAPSYELSHAQKRLWLLDKVVPNSPFYNIPGAVLIDGIELDLVVLRDSLQAVVDRHETLRTVFMTIEDDPVQVIIDGYRIEMPVYNLMSDADKEEKLQTIISEEKVRPFDLEKGPLFRAILIKLTPSKNVFIIVMHHIISDGWSMSILVQEVIGNYLAFGSKNQSPYTILPVQYKDYAFWQNKLLEGDFIKEQEKYWIDNLSDNMPVLNLPTDRPRPAVQTQRAGTARMKLDEKLLHGIKELARKEDVTMFMLTLALFNIMLSKLSGQEDIIVGSPIAGRNNTQIEPLIGFFVNVLPMRVNLTENPGFSELLKRVKETAMGAYANQEYPFDRLVEVINPARDLSRSPIFDITFEFREASANPFVGVSGITIKDVTGDDPNSRFDMSVTGYEEADGVTMRFEYNADLFDAATIERMMGYYRNLLVEVIESQDKPIGDLRMISQDERNQVLVEFNRSASTFPVDKCTHELFEEQVALYPEKTALVFGQDSITYSELNARANRIAQQLRINGVERGTYVAIMVERSFDMMASVLGILKAGGAYVPIDPDYPESRIQYMLDEIKAPVAIIHASLLDRLAGFDGHILNLDKFWKEASSAETGNIRNDTTALDCAYVIYTSGSTGKPKGVMVPHQGITRLVRGTNYADITADDRFLQVATIAFDAATMEFWGPLLNGGTLVLAASGDVMSPERLADLILDNDITILFLTTVLYNQVIDARPDAFSKLKRLLVGGESLSVAHVRKGLAITQPGVFANVYGPTENTTYSTYYTVRELPEGTMSIPIGFPLANSTVYILDKYMMPVPVGVPGELYLGGKGVALGYLNDSERTAEVFVNNPIPEIEETVLYKTGDLGKWLPEGAVDFLGRIDQQVKIRGHRIELGEIEAELRKRPEIKDCVVIVKDLGGGNKYLVAYYVSEEEIAIDMMRSLLKAELPDYMVPNIFMRLDMLPLNKNGKVDKAALPEPEALRPQMATAYVPPANDIEASIVRIWEDILGINEIGIRDNFFDLGGHSLKATQVISRIEKELGFEIPLRRIFEDPTVEGICKSIVQEQGRGFRAIEPLPAAKAYELSHAQKRLWFLDQMIPNSPAYNVPIAFMIDGPIDIDILARSIQLVVDRHETLRTTFAATDTGPVQIIKENLPVVLVPEDLTGLDESALLKIWSEEAYKPFDLARGPLFRVRLFMVSKERHMFIFNMHHIISDGWSLERLMNEIFIAYGAFAEGITPQLPYMKVQYRDYAAWQNSLLAEGALKSQEEYWVKNLSGNLPIIELTTDRHRPSMATTNGTTMRFDLDPEMSQALKGAAKEQNVTLFMYLLGALDVLLSRMTGQNDIIVGSPIAGRNNPDLEPLIGFFVNSLALRTNLIGEPDFNEVLRRVKETCLGAYANQDFPFDKLIDLLDLPRDTSRTPIFNIMFAMQDFSALMRMGETGTFSIRPVEGELKTTKFDLTVFAFDMGNYISIRLEFNTDLFDTSTMTDFVQRYTGVMRQVVERPDLPITQYAIMTAEEYRKVVVDFNATACEYQRERTIVELFEDTARTKPNHPAVVFGDNSLTFDALNRRANRLARCLQDYGVGPNVIVALLVSNPLDTVTGILGILKSGGAYMPIDPEWPSERIEFMLADSNAPVAVCSSVHVVRLPSNMATLCLDRDYSALEVADDGNSNTKVTAEDTAYAIYTSGSTGKPKGSLVPHRGVVNLVAGLEKILYDYYEGDLKVAQVASFTFDASVQQIFASLLLGHTLYPVPSDMKRDMAQLIPYILDNAIDVIDGTPSLWEMMTASGIMDESRLELRHIIIGGEALPVDVLRRFNAGTYGKATRWTNVYGVTESSVDSTYYLADLNTLKGKTYVPIGAPIVNTQIYILDKNLNPMPIGLPGEIYIGGDGLSRGYLNNPEKTMMNFVPNPFAAGSRLYKSGDLGKWLPDGNVEFLGRIDFQVKIHGFRIELGEIESVLGSYESISDCVVIDKQDGPGNKYLVAYYVAPEEISVTELRAFLLHKLPEYMVPVRYMRLDALPLNTSGKVDRNALPEFEGVRPEMTSVYVEPSTKMELVLAEVWKEVLKIDKVGIYDNFFDLGGDSIISLQVVNRLKKRGYLIRPRHMFEYQTIAEIMPVVEKIAASSVELGPVTGDSPLTPIQKYFFELKLKNPNHYNQGVMIQSKVRIREEGLRRALNAIIEHHDVLRSRFSDGQQHFTPLGEEPYLIVRDVENEDEIKAEMNRLQTVLDIEHGPVFATGLFRTKDFYYLLVVCHHLVVDGVSWRIIIEDLMRSSGPAISDSAINLPEKTTSYREWAHQLAAYASSDEVKAEIPYWESEASEAFMSVPVDYDNGPNEVAASDLVMAELGTEETVHFLTDAHQAYNTEVNDLLMAAFMRTLSGWSGNSHIAFDMEGHGREDVLEGIDISRTVGWFTSLYPVVFDAEQDDIGKDIKYVKEKLHAIPNKGFNFGVLRYLAGQPLKTDSGISFNYLGQISVKGLEDTFRVVPIELTSFSDGHNLRPYLLDVVCMVTDEKLRIEVIYSRNRHDRSTIERLTASLRDNLAAVIEHCLKPENFDITPSDFNLVQMDQEALDKLADFD